MSAPTYRRQAIVEFALSRLEQIQIANGYQTDAGLSVSYGGAPELGPDDPSVACALTIPPDESKWQGAYILLGLPLTFHAVAKANLDAGAYLAAEVVLGDIKKAIETDDRTWGRLLSSDLERGRTSTFPRHEGSLVVGLSIGYTAPYRERWGHPEV